jgi:uncharacterized HAD superfamily protein
MKDKVKIAVDIDDTIISFYSDFISFCRDNYNLELSELNLSEDFIGSFGSFEKGVNALKDFVLVGGIYKQKFYKGFVNNLERLEDDFEVFFVTSRGFDLRERTRLFFRNNLGKDYPIHYIWDYNINKKSYVCNQLGIETIVEDDGKNALDCAREGLKAILLDKSWNQNVEHENLFRVKNWHEIIKKLKELKND